MTSSRPDIRVDEAGRLGNYRILRPLGRGGMGDVYLAWTGLRLVAVKILHANFASDPTFVAMFLAEARVAGRINHSAIAQVLDVGMDGGRLYMVMEYVAGHTLDDLINDTTIRSARPLTAGAGGGEEDGGEDTKVSEESFDVGPSLFPMRIALTVFAQVAHALAAAHRAQVVHRDISPHNILISDTGAVKLIDFGIARTQNEDVRTSPGTFRGRFGYMAPEYVQGRPCDHRVDLFALGVVMWETFTRRRLYPGAAAAQLYAVIERPADRLDAVIPDFPLLLADVVERLLERDPDDRYDNAVEVAQTLEKLLPALPDGGFRNLAHWTERHLSERIEARAIADHDDLQVVVAEEAAEQASYEPEIELRRYSGSHSGSQSGSQSQAGAWPASTVASRLPPKLAFGLGMIAAALVAAAVALWVMVARGQRPVAPAPAVASAPATNEPAVPSARSLAPEPAANPGGADVAAAGQVPASPLEPPVATRDPEPELELAEPAAPSGASDDDDDGKRAQKRRDADRKDKDNAKDGAGKGKKEPAALPQAQARTVEPPKPVEPVVTAPEPPPAKTPSVTTSIPQLAPPPPPVPSGPPRTPRVAANVLGDPGRGGTVLGQCNACHSEQKKKRIEGKHMTRSQWERFFRNGTHDRYRPLGDRLSQSDLAAAKAFLMGRALDATEDQSAGVR